MDQHQPDSLAFIVESKVSNVDRHLFLEEVDEKNRNAYSSPVINLPVWISSKVFSMLETYIRTKSLSLYKEHTDNPTLIIQTLRSADFLSLCSFLEGFISTIILPSLQPKNCMVYLEQTHKKLRSQQSSAQYWFTLLNGAINYISINIKQVYRVNRDRLKKLHEKIVTEILDRAIKIRSKDTQVFKVLFWMAQESKKVESADELCIALRQSITNKKINHKVHAKLSWKLQQLQQIVSKTTKKFKFLELDWHLDASRKSPSSPLFVKLHYYPQKQRSCQIGAIYIKLLWSIQSSKKNQGKDVEKIEQKIKMDYILMNKEADTIVLQLSSEKEKQIIENNGKMELNIFCSFDQIYGFVLNYIIQNCDTLMVDEKKLTIQELSALIKASKQKKNYSQALRFIKYLSHLQNQVPQEFLQDYPISELTFYQNDFLMKIKKKQIQLPTQVSVSNSVGKASRRSEERPQSRGRLRKIFASSPNKSLVESKKKENRIEQIERVTSMSNYFLDKQCQLYHLL